VDRRDNRASLDQQDQVDHKASLDHKDSQELRAIRVLLAARVLQASRVLLEQVASKVNKVSLGLMETRDLQVTLGYRDNLVFLVSLD